MSSNLEFTGERMVPTGADVNTFWEHVDRYRFACSMANGRDVLDIACGEGYGSAALLRSLARSVVGVDISNDAVEHAKRTYGLHAICGSAEAIPLADNSVNYIVSFETVEHVITPEKFLAECIRVLQPQGTLLISTPNLDVYRVACPENPFHCSEMTADGFMSLMKSHFKSVEYYGQNPPDPTWMRMRGGGKLQRLGQKFFNPHRVLPLTDELRRKVVELSCEKISSFGKYLTSTSVRKMPLTKVKQCGYIIAKATIPNKPGAS